MTFVLFLSLLSVFLFTLIIPLRNLCREIHFPFCMMKQLGISLDILVQITHESVLRPWIKLLFFDANFSESFVENWCDNDNVSSYYNISTSSIGQIAVITNKGPINSYSKAVFIEDKTTSKSQLKAEAYFPWLFYLFPERSNNK